jgi:hypothetical protein
MTMKRNNDAVIDRIIAAIELTGKDIDGYQAGDVDRRTFSRWMKHDEDFRSRVEAARSHYQRHSLPEMRRMCIKGLSRTLKAVAEGLEIVTTQTTDAINPRTGEIETLETITRKPAMVPVQQAFQYVMGKEIDLIGWLHQGVNLGVLPLSLVESLSDDIDSLHTRIRDRISGTLAPTENQVQHYDPSNAIAAALGLTDMFQATPKESECNLYQEIG